MCECPKLISNSKFSAGARAIEIVMHNFLGFQPGGGGGASWGIRPPGHAMGLRIDLKRPRVKRPMKQVLLFSPL